MEEQEVVSAPAAEAAPETAPTAGQVTAPEGEEQHQPEQERTFTQKELDAILQTRIAKAERRAQREADRRIAEVVGQRREPEPKAVERPTPDKFASTEEYIEAVAEWKADQVISTREARQQEARQQHEAASLRHTWQERMAVAAEKYDDFDEVVNNPRLTISQAMAEAIMLSESGPDVSYFLGSNPKDAARIAALPPVLQVKEIGKIEARLAEAPTRTPTKHPPPIVPSGSTATVSKDPSKMSDKEFNEWRRRQIAQRR